MKDNNETTTTNNANTAPSSDGTTLNTWGRVAQDQMARMSRVFAHTAEMQQSALDHGRELVDHHLKIASEWHSWANETHRKVLGQLLASK